MGFQTVTFAMTCVYGKQTEVEDSVVFAMKACDV